MEWYVEQRTVIIRKEDEYDIDIIGEDVVNKIIIRREEGNIFKFVRAEIYKVSATEFGKLLGLERQQVGRLENGRTKLTKVHLYALKGILLESGYDIEFIKDFLP